MQIDLAEAATAWAPLAGTVFVPHTEEEYSNMIGAPPFRISVSRQALHWPSTTVCQQE